MSVLEVRNLTKSYGHLEVLRGVSLSLQAGEIVALLGDNGAGKSTLSKIMSGTTSQSGGEILVGGQTVEFTSVRDAQSAGVDMVYQDLALSPDLTVTENIFLGSEVSAAGIAGLIGMMDRDHMEKKSREALGKLAVSGINPKSLVSDLSGGQRQAVAIARAILRAKSALILDEPTAALGPRQSDMVCDAIRNVASTGIGVMIVAHDLQRMLTLATSIAILHRGQIVLQDRPENLDVPTIVAAMMGNERNGKAH